MRVLVINPPASLVSLIDAKAHLKVRHNDEDDLIEAYIAAAQSHIDGPDGWLGRAIGEQDLELRLNSFACTDIKLPFPEILGVTSIKYLDDTGVEQTMDEADYEHYGRIVAPVWGGSWPTPGTGRERVRIRYSAGYEVLPDAIKAAVLLMVGDLYKSRETFVTGTVSAAVPMSMTVERLLQPFRVYA